MMRSTWVKIGYHYAHVLSVDVRNQTIANARADGEATQTCGKWEAHVGGVRLEGRAVDVPTAKQDVERALRQLFLQAAGLFGED